MYFPTNYHLLFVIIINIALTCIHSVKVKETITSSTPVANEYFGETVSIHNNYAIVGGDGSAYIFEKDTTNAFTQITKLQAPDDGSANTLEFGYSVSIYHTIAVVGAPNTNTTGSGSVYVFERSVSSGTSSWTQIKQLSPSISVASFGSSVAMYDFTVVIGAPDSDDGDKGISSGSAYIFQGFSEGATWTEMATIWASDGSSNAFFGYSVSIFAKTVAIGAYGSDFNQGAVYVFNHASYDLTDTVWTQTGKLVSSDGISGDQLGYSVGIYEEKYVITGARNHNSNKGAAYVFRKKTSVWIQKFKLEADDATANDYFGESVSIYDTYAVVGSIGNNDGTVYVFERASGAYTIIDRINDVDNADYIGWSVHIYDNHIITGAPYNDGSAVESGLVYIVTSYDDCRETEMSNDDYYMIDYVWTQCSTQSASPTTTVSSATTVSPITSSPTTALPTTKSPTTSTPSPTTASTPISSGAKEYACFVAIASAFIAIIFT